MDPPCSSLTFEDLEGADAKQGVAVTYSWRWFSKTTRKWAIVFQLTMTEAPHQLALATTMHILFNHSVPW